MAADNQREREDPDIPPDSTVIKQSMWLWIWSAIPWIIVTLIFSQAALTMAIFALILAVLVTFPRFIAWRNTAIYLSSDELVYQRGTFGGSRKYFLRISELTDVVTRDGMFGKGLGYHEVAVILGDGSKLRLPWVPSAVDLPGRLRRLMAPYGRDSEPGAETKE